MCFCPKTSKPPYLRSGQRPYRQTRRKIILIPVPFVQFVIAIAFLTVLLAQQMGLATAKCKLLKKRAKIAFKNDFDSLG